MSTTAPSPNAARSCTRCNSRATSAAPSCVLDDDSFVLDSPLPHYQRMRSDSLHSREDALSRPQEQTPPPKVPQAVLPATPLPRVSDAVCENRISVCEDRISVCLAAEDESTRSHDAVEKPHEVLSAIKERVSVMKKKKKDSRMMRLKAKRNGKGKKKFCKTHAVAVAKDDDLPLDSEPAELEVANTAKAVTVSASVMPSCGADPLNAFFQAAFPDVLIDVDETRHSHTLHLQPTISKKR